MAPALRVLDASLVAALVASSAGLFMAFPASLLAAVAACALLTAATGLCYVSWGTCAWHSTAHLASHGSDLATRLSAAKHVRNVGRALPCPYPDAWFVVAISRELPPGGVVDAVACGHSLVVWRTSAGAPVVMDAYCAHNGAHLAHGGGRVEGDCIRCPFHGWCYDQSGRAVSTPVDPPPKGVTMRSWPVLERNGVISVWMSAAVSHRSGGGSGGGCDDALGSSVSRRDDTSTPLPPPPALQCSAEAPDAPEAVVDALPSGTPWYTPPLFADLSTWPYHGFVEHHVPALIFELPENGADIAHLNALHNAFVVPALRRLLSHRWAATWEPDSENKHLANMTVRQSMLLLGFELPGPVHVRITQCGPSQVVLFFTLPAIGRLCIVETVTPQAPALQRVLHVLFAEPCVPRALAKVVLYSLVQAYEQDVPVWAHKRYEPTPRLTASEGPVRAFRTWARQFYRDPRSVSFEAAQRAHLRKTLGYPDDAARSELMW